MKEALVRLESKFREKGCIQGPHILLNSKKELSQISRTTGRKMMKICENLKEGNSNHCERFHSKRENISARFNDWKFVASFGQDVPIKTAKKQAEKIGLKLQNNLVIR